MASKRKFYKGSNTDLTESLTVELKEVRNKHPSDEIARKADRYAVAFLNTKGGSIYWGIRDDSVVSGIALNANLRDEVITTAGNKLSAIAPHVPTDLYNFPLHTVYDAATQDEIKDLFVVELKVAAGDKFALHFTSSGEAYERTLKGTRKLSGAELINRLGTSLHKKQEAITGRKPNPESFSALERRAQHIAPIIRHKRVLWVDDNLDWTTYERALLSQHEIFVDTANSTDAALNLIAANAPDVIVSDIERAGNNRAGLQLLEAKNASDCKAPVVFYIGAVDPDRAAPKGSFGIADHPDDVVHLIFDALVRS